MDVKVGTVSYEADATPEKIAYEKQKFPLQETVGLRIQGIKVLDPATQQYEELDKHFGRQAGSLEELVTAFGRYFPLAADSVKSIALLRAVRGPFVLYVITSAAHTASFLSSSSSVCRSSSRFSRRSERCCS